MQMVFVRWKDDGGAEHSALLNPAEIAMVSENKVVHFSCILFRGSTSHINSTIPYKTLVTALRRHGPPILNDAQQAAADHAENIKDTLLYGKTSSADLADLDDATKAYVQSVANASEQQESP